MKKHDSTNQRRGGGSRETAGKKQSAFVKDYLKDAELQAKSLETLGKRRARASQMLDKICHIYAAEAKEGFNVLPGGEGFSGAVMYLFFEEHHDPQARRMGRYL